MFFKEEQHLVFHLSDWNYVLSHVQFSVSWLKMYCSDIVSLWPHFFMEIKSGFCCCYHSQNSFFQLFVEEFYVIFVIVTLFCLLIQHTFVLVLVQNLCAIFMLFLNRHVRHTICWHYFWFVDRHILCSLIKGEN